ncbi:MAG: hypothetical protein CVU13_10950 [Bacteroidetes bacterium HGW-Bacteroidetes-8]|jgi:RNA polymerase sigma-70 factor (ECF subfamily)|nr:MAG: hypothetical protein CVU13_10950 [Bacteroidetes bacterium HGW-Bacteroidetes-8]
MISEDKIIERVLDGETEMFRLLVERYHERIFILSRGFVHQVQDAEDITQETFLRAFISLGSFRGSSEFSTWLYRIGINSAYTFLRKRDKRTISSFYETKIGAIANLLQTNKNDNPHRLLSSKEAQELIYKEIDRLPERQRVAFIFSRLDDMSQKEIAKIMSLSVHAVESLIQRAKKQLKEKLISVINENDLQ